MAGDNLQTCPIPGVGRAISLCGEEGITFKNHKYVPDKFRGFFTFSLCHAFPVVNEHGVAFHPNVLSRSFRGLQFQGVNRGHSVAAYHKDKQVDDKYAGAVIDVDFPEGGNLTIGSDESKAPAITGLATVFKQAQGMADLMGRHLSGRWNYSVSIEVFWDKEESGFAVPIKQGFKPEFADTTPHEFSRIGYEYVPWGDAPPALVKSYSEKENKVTGRYKNKKVAVMAGGLSGEVYFAGVGIVMFPAEKPAKIMRLAAGIDFSAMEKLADSIALELRLAAL